MSEEETADLETAIFEHIRQAGNITFVELQQIFGEGEYKIYFESNIILWAGLPEAVCNALISLTNKKRIKYEPCGLLVYVLDGMIMYHPVVTTVPTEGGFKCLCWLPVVISVDGKQAQPKGQP